MSIEMAARLALVLIVLSSAVSGYLGLYGTLAGFAAMSLIYFSVKPKPKAHWLWLWTIKLKAQLFSLVISRRSITAALLIVLISAIAGWASVGVRTIFEDPGLVVARISKQSIVDLFFLPSLIYVMALSLRGYFDDYESEDDFNRRQGAREDHLLEKYGRFGVPDTLEDMFLAAAQDEPWQEISIPDLFGLLFGYVVVFASVVVPFLIGVLVQGFWPIRMLEDIRDWVPSWV